MSRGRSTLVLAAVAALAPAAGCTPAPIDVGGLAPGGLANDLIAHWSFDDASPTLLKDDSPNVRDGIITGATRVAGHFGGALHFQDSHEVVVRNFPQAADSWTVSAWVRPDDAQPGAGDFVTLISTEIPFIGGWEMNIVPITGMMSYHFGYFVGREQDDYDFVECPCVQTGTWTHLAAVVDGPNATLSLYTNGAIFKTVPTRKPIAAGSPNLFMGSWYNAQTDPQAVRYFTGALDDVAVWRRALVPEEVGLLATQPAPNR